MRPEPRERAPRRRQVDADWVVSAWVWALLFVVILPTRADPDLWGHLRFGQDWLATGSLSYVDPYSFTQDRPWINHEWLSEALMAFAYATGGVAGLLVLKVLLVALGLLVLAGALAPLPVLVRSACLLLATWSAVAPMTLTIRPHLWSWLFTILLARLLLSPPSRRLLVFMPLLFAVWMNVHGGVLVGIALLAAWTIYHVWTTQGSRWMPLAIAVVGVFATLVNPYGPRLWQFFAETVRVGRDIQEWRPIWTAQLEGWALPWSIAAAAVVALAFSRARPRIDRLAVMLVLAYASARTMRLVPLFVVVSMIYLMPSLRVLTGRGWMAWKLRAPSPLAAALAIIPLLLVVATVHRAVWTNSRDCVSIRGDWAPDRAVAAALRASSPTGRLVTTYGWGQYAIWHFGPSLRVSFDGRLETVYSDATDMRQVDIERGNPDGLRFLADSRPEYVWLSPSSAGTRDWLGRQADYRIDLETPMSFLGVRADLPVVRPVKDVPSACFPG